MTGTFHHHPVMYREVTGAFASVPAGLLVDGTVGGAGHARALLDARPDCSLLGLDRDAEAVTAATTALAPYGERAVVVHAGFENLAELVEEPAAGVLYDLGVSSPQLDRPERGFSYRTDAPLDMRMDRSQALSAREVVNDYEEAELARVIARWGEERFARAIARRIAARRPLETTAELAEVVRDAIPAPARRRGPHPARRTFQAIRMEVNAELDHLAAGLDAAFAALVPGGRLAVLSYHSLEDRMVKHRFTDWTSPPVLPRGLPLPPDHAPPPGVVVTRRALRPSAAEIDANPRAESARLRVVERRGRP
ncbi:MAG: 16S rRNA (cytosine(1402)-N(4))-methyltransferase RsmH [Actinomycetota bacterium]|nr:16S rRNA (cytosine(1402)-N(4))-methyltransferase RsmH [Actinomycetota bacterium]